MACVRGNIGVSHMFESVLRSCGAIRGCIRMVNYLFVLFVILLLALADTLWLCLKQTLALCTVLMTDERADVYQDGECWRKLSLRWRVCWDQNLWQADYVRTVSIVSILYLLNVVSLCSDKVYLTCTSPVQIDRIGSCGTVYYTWHHLFLGDFHWFAALMMFIAYLTF